MSPTLDIAVACGLILLGLGVACGEMIAAWFARPGKRNVNMERDIPPPATIVPEEPTAPIVRTELRHRVPTYIEETGELTMALQSWEKPRPPTVYESERAQQP